MTPEELDERIEWSGVPLRYRRCSFDSFNSYLPALKAKCEQVKKLAAQTRSVFLFGPPGAGKTHLATAVMVDWLSRGGRGHFIKALEYTYAVQKAYGEASELVRDLTDNHFVLLDDLGAERSSESTRSALLYLVDELYARKKRLIITSNLTLDAIEREVEPRIASRLVEACVIVEVKAPDYRLRLAEERRRAGKAAGGEKVVN